MSMGLAAENAACSGGTGALAVNADDALRDAGDTAAGDAGCARAINANAAATASDDMLRDASRGSCGSPASASVPSTLRIEDVLASEGVFVSTSAGVSMWPMLRNRRDTVVIRPVSPGQRLRRFDVPLYRRGDDYVLHRIIDVRPGSYVIRGDNCLQKEHVADDRVIGVLCKFFRDGKHVSLSSPAYRAYVRVWHALFPLRACWKRTRARLARVVRAARISRG